MARLTFLEKQKSTIVDFEMVCRNISEIMHNDWRYYNELNEFYKCSSFTGGGHKSLDELFEFIFSIKENKFTNSSDFCLETCLDYFEVLINLIWERMQGHSARYTEENQIKIIISTNLDKLNYAFHYNEEDEMREIYLKNAKVESVISMIDDDNISTKLYKYLSTRDGDVERKYEILHSLINEIEVDLNELIKDEKSDYNNVREIFQCVRHEPKKFKLDEKFPFFYDDRKEVLYDKIFFAMVSVISASELKYFSKEIKENKVDIK